MIQENPLGRYTVLRELGRGAIGTVCAARDRSTGATVALKTLDPELLGAADAKLARAFLKNGRSTARLRHQNIVQVHDAGEAGGTVYVATELAGGESLREMLDGRPLPMARAVRIFDDIASALAYAHEEGIVHRGVRPSNIVLLPSGVAQIGDFGIGQIGEAALPYMSPEQVLGNTAEHPVDHRTDLFSLGTVFYQMLTGRAPFSGASPKEIKESILRAQPPRPSEANPHVPAALDALVAKLLARNPDERFASARLLLRDLQRLEEALGLRRGLSPVPIEPTLSVPPGPPDPTLRPEPTLRPPDPTLRPPEPQPRTPAPQQRTSEPNRFRDPAPMHDAPEPTWHDPGPDAGDPRTHDVSPRFHDVSPRFHDDSPRIHDVSPRSHDVTPRSHDSRPMPYRAPARQPRPGSRTPVLATLALLLAVLSIGLTVFLHYSPDLGDRLLAILKRQAPPTVTAGAPFPSTAPSPSTAPALATKVIEHPSVAPPAPPLPPPAADDAKPEETPTVASARDPLPSKPPAKAPTFPPRTASLPAPKPAQTAKATTAPPQETPKAAKPIATPSKPQPSGTAKLTIAIAPRGEIYIDGKHKGTTPPITTLDLAPGLHRIEIRHGSRRPYLTYITVEPGDQRRIRYDFNARGHPPA